MTNRTAETSPLIYARVAGFMFLFTMATGIFSSIIRSNLIVPGDAATHAGLHSGR